MKKLLALLLALALMLTFAACGVKDDDDDKDDKDKTSQSASGDNDNDDGDKDSEDDASSDESDKNDSSSEGNDWDDDYYNNIVIHWTDALDISDYTNFTFTANIKSEQLGDSVQSVAFNGDSATIDGESVAGAQDVTILKDGCLGIVLDLLKSASMEYDYKTQLYTSSYALCEFAYDGDKAYITAYDIEFYIDSNMHLTHFSCRMEQEITSSSGNVTNISIENYTVTLSDFGTTK